jgi:hypothetical protein
MRYDQVGQYMPYGVPEEERERGGVNIYRNYDLKLPNFDE